MASSQHPGFNPSTQTFQLCGVKRGHFSGTVHPLHLLLRGVASEVGCFFNSYFSFNQHWRCWVQKAPTTVGMNVRLASEGSSFPTFHRVPLTSFCPCPHTALCGNIPCQNSTIFFTDLYAPWQDTTALACLIPHIQNLLSLSSAVSPVRKWCSWVLFPYFVTWVLSRT